MTNPFENDLNNKPLPPRRRASNVDLLPNQEKIDPNAGYSQARQRVGDDRKTKYDDPSLEEMENHLHSSPNTPSEDEEHAALRGKERLHGPDKADNSKTSGKSQQSPIAGGAGTSTTPLDKPKSDGVSYIKQKKRGLVNSFAKKQVNSTGKKLLLGGAVVGLGSVVLIIGVALILIFTFFGSLKVVHFSTVLRSVGFARFNILMQQQYARTIFDAATLTDYSTGVGSKALGDRSMVQRLLGVNPQARLTELGQEGTLKFVFQKESQDGWRKILGKTNTFKGVEVNGKSIGVDNISDELFGKTYNNLRLSERLSVQAEFIRQVNEAGLADRLAEEGLSFRSSVYNGLRQLAGIKMWKWALDQYAKYKNDTPAEALKQDVDDTANYVDEPAAGDIPTTGIDAVEEPAQQAYQATLAEAEVGDPVNNVPTGASKLIKRLQVVDDVSTVAFIATSVCIIHSLSDSFQQADQDDMLKALRMGHDALTSGDQIEQGNNDVNAQEVGAEAQRWDGADTALFYKQAVGEPITNADEAQISNIPSITGPATLFSNIIGDINDIFKAATLTSPLAWLEGVNKFDDQICNVVLNQYAQYGLAGAELVIAAVSAGSEYGVLTGVRTALQGGLEFAGTVGLGELLGQLIDMAVKNFSNLDYSGTANNQLLFNESYMGVDALQQTGIRQINYGKPIMPSEASQEQGQAMAYERNLNSQQPLTQRYFAIDNPFSLIGSISAYLPTSFTDVASDLRMGVASLVNIFQPLNLFNTLGSVLEPQAAASSNQPTLTGAVRGLQEWGWTSDELGELNNDPEYTWEANANFVEPQLDYLNGLYQQCYTPIIQEQEPSVCTEAYLSTPTALHWRAYEAEAYSADHLAPGQTDQ